MAFNEDRTIPVSVAVVFANGAARLLKLETAKKSPSHSSSFKVHMKNERGGRENGRNTLLGIRVSLHHHYNLSNGSLLLTCVPNYQGIIIVQREGYYSDGFLSSILQVDVE